MLHLKIDTPEMGSHLTAKGGRLRAKHAEMYAEMERKAREEAEAKEQAQEEVAEAPLSLTREHSHSHGLASGGVADASLASELSTMNDVTGRTLADLFKMLGDTTRIKLLGKIAGGEMRVGDIAEALGMQPSAISHQLRVLRAARIVTCRRDGKEAWYSLDDDHVVRLMRLGLEHVMHG